MCHVHVSFGPSYDGCIISYIQHFMCHCRSSRNLICHLFKFNLINARLAHYLEMETIQMSTENVQQNRGKKKEKIFLPTANAIGERFTDRWPVVCAASCRPPSLPSSFDRSNSSAHWLGILVKTILLNSVSASSTLSVPEVT